MISIEFRFMFITVATTTTTTIIISTTIAIEVSVISLIILQIIMRIDLFINQLIIPIATIVIIIMPVFLVNQL